MTGIPASFSSPTTTRISTHRTNSSSTLSSSPSSSIYSSNNNAAFSSSIVYPPTPPLEHGYTLANDDGSYMGGAHKIGVRIPSSSRAPPAQSLATPPSTPENDMNYASSGSGGGGGSVSKSHSKPAKQDGDALDFLLTIFPYDGSSLLPYARSVTISDPRLNTSFSGIVLSHPSSPRTLYVDGHSAENVSLRESIVALLDLASEHLECEALVIALDRTSKGLGDLLHSLMYVGGTVVSKPIRKVAPRFVLVGMEI